MIRSKWQLDESYKENFTELLSENLAALRAKAGISQEQLANLIGVSRQTYYALETRKREISWSNFLSLLLFFDTNLNTHELLRSLKLYPTELMRIMTD